MKLPLKLLLYSCSKRYALCNTMCCAATLPIGSLLKYYLNKNRKNKRTINFVIPTA